jgi:hypothetical protein
MILRFKKMEDSDAIFLKDDLTSLRALDTSEITNHSRVYVKTHGEYVFRKNSSLLDNALNVIAPITGGGRWIKIGDINPNNAILKTLSNTGGNGSSITINDSTASTTSVYSSEKVEQIISSLSLEGGTPYIECTYAELYTLTYEGNLVPNTTYILTDYQSTEQIKGAPAGTYYTAPVEKLVLIAKNKYEFQSYAVSLTYPGEIVKYDISINKARLSQKEYVNYNWENDAEYPDNYHSEGVIGIGYDYLQLAGAEFMPIAGMPFYYDVEWNDWNDWIWFEMPMLGIDSEWIRLDYVNNRIYFKKYETTGFPSDLSGIYCSSFKFILGDDRKGQTGHRVQTYRNNEYTHDYRAHKFRRYKMNLVPAPVDGTHYPANTLLLINSYLWRVITDSTYNVGSIENLMQIGYYDFHGYPFSLTDISYFGCPITIDVNAFTDNFVSYEFADTNNLKIITGTHYVPDFCLSHGDNSTIRINYNSWNGPGGGKIGYIRNSNVIICDKSKVYQIYDSNVDIYNSNIYYIQSVIGVKKNYANFSISNISTIYESSLSSFYSSTIYRIQHSIIQTDKYYDNTKEYSNIFIPLSGSSGSDISTSINDNTPSFSTLYSSSMIETYFLRKNQLSSQQISGNGHYLTFDSSQNKIVGENTHYYGTNISQSHNGFKEYSIKIDDDKTYVTESKEYVYDFGNRIGSIIREISASSHSSNDLGFGGMASINIAVGSLMSSYVDIQAFSRLSLQTGTLSIRPNGLFWNDVDISNGNANNNGLAIDDNTASSTTVYSSFKANSTYIPKIFTTAQNTFLGSNMWNIYTDTNPVVVNDLSYVNDASVIIQKGSVNINCSLGSDLTTSQTKGFQATIFPQYLHGTPGTGLDGFQMTTLVSATDSDNNGWGGNASISPTASSTGGKVDIVATSKTTQSQVTGRLTVKPDGIYWNNQKINLTFV